MDDRSTIISLVQIVSKMVDEASDALLHIEQQHYRKDRVAVYKQLVTSMQTFKRYGEFIIKASDPSCKHKRVLIEYKDLDLTCLRNLTSATLNAKNVQLILKKAIEMLEVDIAKPIRKMNESLVYQFTSYFCSKLELMMRIVFYLTKMLTYGSVLDANDILNLSEEEFSEVDKWIQKFEMCPEEQLASKYTSLGWKYMIIKAACSRANGNTLGIFLTAPLYAVFNNYMEYESNKFYSAPEESVLEKIWNLPQCNSLFRATLDFLSRKVKVKKDLYFRNFFPEFNLQDIDSGNYKTRLNQTIPKFTEEMKQWNIFEKPKVDSADLLRVTVLSNGILDAKKKILPLSEKSNHTIVIYGGGGGFLANLQLIQENFLKKWVSNTNVTLFQAHYRLCPKYKSPVQTNDLFNMYMQIILYYKLVQGVKDLKVILMGDSAGANIILSLMNVLASLDTEIPTKVVAIYPPTDLRNTRFTPSLLHSFDDKLLFFTVGKSCLDAYTPENADLQKDYLLSPALASDDILAKYPRTFFFVGEKDSLRDDCLRMAYRIHKLGKAKSTLVQAQGTYHGFLGFELPLGIGINEVSKIHTLIESSITENSASCENQHSISTKDSKGDRSDDDGSLD